MEFLLKVLEKPRLDNKRKDSNGIPGVKINYTLSKNTKKMLAHGLKKGKELMEAAGSKKTIAYGPVKHTGWHIMGTTKMGKKKTKFSFSFLL